MRTETVQAKFLRSVTECMSTLYGHRMN